MAARRAVQAKALAAGTPASLTGARKSTSMTNLNANGSLQPTRPMQRPASRNALDSIHKGMNAKFTHVQSKVLLHNIRPQLNSGAGGGSSSKIPSASSTLVRNSTQNVRKTAATGGQAKSQQSDKSQMINKIKTLQEELAASEAQSELFKQELEREKADKLEQVNQVKLELQEKAAEQERHNEEYHQKLLEAYELADANRRAADNVLAESRQREDELRKQISDLEQQLAELKEFVSMKEEMVSKMGELREQIRVERERYEEKTRTLNQLFESEKVSDHMRVDQNSNYFRRAKPSLQSIESIHRLDADTPSEEQQRRQQRQQHRSEHDLYGSKLSTRMQDGAKFAWKKSRKFASSVITGSLGGLSACRKRVDLTSKADRPVSSTGAKLGVSCEPPAPVEAVTQEPPTGEQHTSVIEVQQTNELQVGGPQRAAIVAQDETTAASQRPVKGHNREQISVDENNKLTIVTKFNVAEPESQPVSAGSERSRCESSSSGRGTASDTCSSGASQNDDSERADNKTAPSDDYQRHKRKASLFKASNVLQGSQVSPDKTFGSFFANSPNAGDAAAFDLADATAFQEPPAPSSFKQMRDIPLANNNNNNNHERTATQHQVLEATY